MVLLGACHMEERIANIKLGIFAQRVISRRNASSKVGWCPLGNLFANEATSVDCQHFHGIMAGKISLEQRSGMFDREDSMEEQLQKHVLKQLPESRLPSQWVVSSLPFPVTGQNGEVDRDLLSSGFDWQPRAKENPLGPVASRLQNELSTDHTYIVSAVMECVQTIRPDLNVKPQTPLFAAGLTSIESILVSKSLSKTLGVKLPATLVFNHPCVDDIAAYVLSLNAPFTFPGVAIQHVRQVNRLNVCIASSASSCSGVQGLSYLLMNGTECLNPFPDRFDVGLPNMSNEIYVKHGYFLPNPELFDNQFFRISPAEAAVLDPHQRLMLQTSYSALASNHMSRSSVNRWNIGVYAGVMSAVEWIPNKAKTAHVVTSSGAAFIA